MSIFVHCIMRNCFDPIEQNEVEDDQEGNNRRSRNDVFLPQPPRHFHVNRTTTPASYEPPTSDHLVAADSHQTNTSISENEEEGPIISRISARNDSGDVSLKSRGLFSFLHKFGAKHFLQQDKYEFLGRPNQQYPTDPNTNGSNEDGNNKIKGHILDHHATSPLRQAENFKRCDSINEIPTIALEEVVLPGSDIQRQMSLNLKRFIDKDDKDECVICMENFDATNPRMPTLCGCGENKTFFHLPCLYQWIEKNEECPSCRQKLRWQEF